MVIVPWQPASAHPPVGSRSTARSPPTRSGLSREEPLEPVVLVGDLLALVEDEGEVVTSPRPCRILGEAEHDRHPALHVGGAQAPKNVTLDDRRLVPVRRHRVEMTGQHDAARRTVLRARDHVLPEALHRESGCPIAEPRLNRVGDLPLAPTDRRHRYERRGEAEEVGAVLRDEVLRRGNRAGLAHVNALT